MIVDIPSDPALACGPVAEWLAHYEAGRLGPRPPLAPEILAQLQANDALFRARAESFAAARRAACTGVFA